jgi:hypothetical protein
MILINYSGFIDTFEQQFPGINQRELAESALYKGFRSAE